MIKNVPENSQLIEYMLLLVIVIGFAVCTFIARSIVLNFKREEKKKLNSFENTL